MTSIQQPPPGGSGPINQVSINQTTAANVNSQTAASAPAMAGAESAEKTLRPNLLVLMKTFGKEGSVVPPDVKNALNTVSQPIVDMAVSQPIDDKAATSGPNQAADPKKKATLEGALKATNKLIESHTETLRGMTKKRDNDTEWQDHKTTALEGRIEKLQAEAKRLQSELDKLQ